MLQAGRSRNAGGYRFGFNGQEADNKIGGLGQHTTAQFWEYDTWAVKRWNVDPVEHSTVSGYSVFMNNPIYYTDPYGLDTFNFNRKSWSASGPNGKPLGDHTDNITINPGGSDVFFYNHTHSHTDANGNEKITSTSTRFYPDDPSGYNPDGLISDVTHTNGAFGFGSYPDRGLTTLAKLAPSTLLEAYAANRPGSNNAFRKALIKQGDLSAYETAQTLQGIFYLAEGGYTLWSAKNAISKACFIAGTTVATANGQKDIKDLVDNQPNNLNLSTDTTYNINSQDHTLTTYLSDTQQAAQTWNTTPISITNYTTNQTALQQQLNNAHDLVWCYQFGNTENNLPYDNEPITPQTWKWIHLIAPQSSSQDTLHIDICRPNWWLLQANADTIGKQVFVEMPEFGVQDWATITQITPNYYDSRFQPDTTTNNYTLRPIIGKFKRQSSDVYQLNFEGNPTSLGVTANHPIYSIDRQTWVPAANLQIGEHVQTRTGTLTLQSSQAQDTTQTVYNLEIYGEHNYLVQEDGLWVHNDCLPDVRWINHNTWNGLKKLGLQDKFKNAMDKGLATRRQGQGSTGIITLTEQEMKLYPGYTYKIKIDGKGASHYRVLGNITNNSKGKPTMIFDKIVND